MAATNKQVVLRRLVAGKPSLDDLELVEGPIPEAQAGEVLVRTIYLSLDPYMRGRMSTPEAVGEVMVGGVVGEVVSSNAHGFKPGQLVCQYVGGYGWQSYGAVAGSQLRVLDPDLVPITTALGVAGMPGVTAYFGLLEVGRPVAGETVVVSAASGAVGAVVGQLAKMKGCRAVGIAGSAEKCAYVVDELQFDVCVNYKTGDLSAALAAACPDGIDVYFDNVGGRVIDAVAAHLAIGARLSLCGAIAEYNDALGCEWTGPHLSRFIQARRATMRGFNQGEFADRHEEALALLATWVRSGALTYKEQVVVGLENAPAAFLGMLEGSNFGKLLVQVSDDPTK